MSTIDNSVPENERAGARSVLGRGALAGICAWLAGYLVVYVARADAVSEALRGVGFVSEVLGGDAIPAWKGVAWLFANAHFVDARLSAPMLGTETFNAVTGEGSGLLLALPPVVLLAAGALAAWARRSGSAPRSGAAGGRDSGLRSAVTAGAAVALGYLPLSVATGFLTEHAIGGSGPTIALDPVTAVLLAGLVYPVVFGALGGAAIAALD
ncbi:hypothetical protein [Halorussus litoreus]|uniref:hypothetical protein n=1 Tax=Halorussus litoreus TaxID=1710536 RepID=UPI0018E577C3|nr:hypothetical protein [Halorussus litoreus]